MSRRAVIYKNASQYNLLHTSKVTLWNGNVVTALYNLKETAKFYSCGIHILENYRNHSWTFTSNWITATHSQSHGV